MTGDHRPLLSVRDLQVRFPVRTDRGKGVVQAVAGIDFDIHRGQTVSLVGESGSGKSTVANALMHLVEPSAGTVLLDGRDVTSVRGRELKALRRRIAMVFQDPFASLDPRQHVSRAVAEPLEVHGLGGDRDGRRRRVADLFEQVGLSRRFLDRYPHELSGGQRQRVSIARALAGEPDLIVLDEATASLDVSVQAQIMNLLNRLQGELGLTYLFIAHDLAVVEHMSDHVLVMYLGRLMEDGGVRDVFDAPAHPYTRALLASAPSADPVAERRRRTAPLEGEVPSPLDPPSGCVFRTRCPWAADECPRTVPAPVPPPGAQGAAPGTVSSDPRQAGPAHLAACIRLPEVQASARGPAPAPDGLPGPARTPPWAEAPPDP
ncbi:ATP-binding cassette domain-containing protein [Kocuria sp. CPCC 205231]|uniref:ABC transporter ATP-binding protein n=1 Tax=Kocuria sp. CPCC 205231 TaxID=3073551 RepID=UPI0034D59931